mgnify:FL=1
MQILLRAFLILLILTIAAALFIVLYKRMRPVRNAHFICPNCGAVTMPGKWARALAPARAAIACCNAPPAVNSATCPLFGTLNRPPAAIAYPAWRLISIRSQRSFQQIKLAHPSLFFYNKEYYKLYAERF